MIGVDPNAFTLASLDNVIKGLRLLDNPGIDMHLVLGAAGDKEGEVTLNAFCGKNGNEVCAIQEGDEKSSGIKVPMFTIDGLGAASKSIENIISSRQAPIDILHIDTEGYDSKVDDRSHLLHPHLIVSSIQSAFPIPIVSRSSKEPLARSSAVGFACSALNTIRSVYGRSFRSRLLLHYSTRPDMTVGSKASADFSESLGATFRSWK